MKSTAQELKTQGLRHVYNGPRNVDIVINVLGEDVKVMHCTHVTQANEWLKLKKIKRRAKYLANQIGIPHEDWEKPAPLCSRIELFRQHGATEPQIKALVCLFDRKGM